MSNTQSFTCSDELWRSNMITLAQLGPGDKLYHEAPSQQLYIDRSSIAQGLQRWYRSSGWNDDLFAIISSTLEQMNGEYSKGEEERTLLNDDEWHWIEKEENDYQELCYKVISGLAYLQQTYQNAGKDEIAQKVHSLIIKHGNELFPDLNMVALSYQENTPLWEERVRVLSKIWQEPLSLSDDLINTLSTTATSAIVAYAVWQFPLALILGGVRSFCCRKFKRTAESLYNLLLAVTNASANVAGYTAAAALNPALGEQVPKYTDFLKNYKYYYLPKELEELFLMNQEPINYVYKKRDEELQLQIELEETPDTVFDAVDSMLYETFSEPEPFVTAIEQLLDRMANVATVESDSNRFGVTLEKLKERWFQAQSTFTMSEDVVKQIGDALINLCIMHHLQPFNRDVDAIEYPHEADGDRLSAILRQRIEGLQRLFSQIANPSFQDLIDHPPTGKHGHTFLTSLTLYLDRVTGLYLSLAHNHYQNDNKKLVLDTINEYRATMLPLFTQFLTLLKHYQQQRVPANLLFKHNPVNMLQNLGKNAFHFCSISQFLILYLFYL